MIYFNMYSVYFTGLYIESFDILKLTIWYCIDRYRHNISMTSIYRSITTFKNQAYRLHSQTKQCSCLRTAVIIRPINDSELRDDRNRNEWSFNLDMINSVISKSSILVFIVKCQALKCRANYSVSKRNGDKQLGDASRQLCPGNHHRLAYIDSPSITR